MRNLEVLKPLSSLLIKPTGADCNIDCKYCFYLDRAGTPRPGFDSEKGMGRQMGRRMSEEVQESLIRQAMRGGSSQISFGWQGGEPTLMGVEFFRRAVSLQRQYGTNGQIVGNGLQTNGLLMDEEWCDFLRETHWLVGLSIDGPAHVHDHYRVTRNGQPTYEKVRAAALLMRAKNVEYNALSVVNSYSVRFAKDIYNHHKDLGIRFMQFIPCVERDPNDPTKAAEFSVSAEDYGKFLCEIFDCWKGDFRSGKPTVSVRYFDSIFHTYVNVPPPECTLLSECGNYVVVEYNGDVFSCDFFVEGEWRLGNVLNDSLIHLLNSPRQKEFGEMKADMPQECYSCDYLAHCHGGCTKDRLRDPADGGSNHFCKSFLRFFRHADPDLKRLAEEWKRQQKALAQREEFLRRMSVR
ncbi:MAG: anaerobic sulfatase maturase [Candidatus Omnitrophica bacterium]|nr:Anaerobic sulfatase-maturating enzyme [bacterium]NUN95079.1 anaerobic sulfatase maturase [Candidatus Omnitrophota bacterium]